MPVSARDRTLIAAVSKLGLRTVDRCYSPDGGVKDLTRDLVTRAALELGIEPPPSASAPRPEPQDP